MEFSRPEYWSGWPIPCPADLPDPGIKLGSPALQGDFFYQLSYQGITDAQMKNPSIPRELSVYSTRPKASTLCVTYMYIRTLFIRITIPKPHKNLATI